jgi:hypothetical protein
MGHPAASSAGVSGTTEVGPFPCRATPGKVKSSRQECLRHTSHRPTGWESDKMNVLIGS